MQEAKTLRASKVPGIDGFPNENLKTVANLKPEFLLNIYNRCIMEARFPAEWKTARLVLIRKENKALGESSSYRPLCMLNTARKLFEKILDCRIRDFLEANGSIADNQYDFRKGRSTIDAVIRLRAIIDECSGKHIVGLLTLDVRNAFNSAPWAGIIEAVTGKRLPTLMCKLLND